MILRQRLTKKHVAKIFGLISPKGQVYSRSLRRDYFTDDVLTQLDLTEEQYKKLKLFTAAQSEKLVEIFDFDQLDLAKVNIVDRRDKKPISE